MFQTCIQWDDDFEEHSTEEAAMALHFIEVAWNRPCHLEFDVSWLHLAIFVVSPLTSEALLQASNELLTSSKRG